MIHIRIPVLLFAVAARVLWGADGPVGVATLGMIYDPAVKGIRPLTGIPGAATMGGRIEIGADLSQAVVSPMQDYALGVAAGDSTVLLLSLSKSTLSSRPLDTIARSPDRIALSPSGACAAFYYSGIAKAWIVAGLPGAPVVASEIDLSALSATLTALGVSDDGQQLLAGSSDSSGGTVYLLSAAGAPRQVAAVSHATAVTFARNSHDAWLADRLQNSILQMRGGHDFVPLAAFAGGIAGPVALEVSADSRKVIVANADSNSVATIDRASGDITVVPCDCVISGLHRMNGQATFSLTDPADHVLWVFDGDAAQPRVVFVPEE